MPLSDNVELHLRRVVDEHISTLINFPANIYSSLIASSNLAEPRAAIPPAKSHTADSIDACEKLCKLVSELHIASSLVDT